MKLFLLNLLVAGALAKKRIRMEKNRRIVGGVNANSTHYPFIVKLEIGDFLCAGSLLNADWILTAAHCLTDDNGSAKIASTRIVAKWGGNKASNSMVADSFIRHPAYDNDMIVDDIALIHLATPAPIRSANTCVHADDGACDGVGLCAPGTDCNDCETCDAKLEYVKFVPSVLPANSQVRAIGWGTDESGSVTENLMEVDIHTVADGAECDYIRADGDTAAGKTVCAGGAAIDAGKDACTGDSGGPLIARWNASSPWQQYGVVSYGYDRTGATENCGETGYWGVYGNPAYYVDWIESQTGIPAASMLGETGSVASSDASTVAVGSLALAFLALF